MMRHPQKWFYRLTTLVIITLIIISLSSFVSHATIQGSLISRSVPVYASSQIYAATNANDSNYGNEWRGAISCWIAYDLSGVPAAQRNQIVAVYYNGSGAYDRTVTGGVNYNNAGSYTIQGNTAAGGGSAPTSGWTTLVTVTNNVYHSRQHVINFSGYNWIRMYVTVSDGSSGNSDISCNFDVHDASKALTDDWIFYGDSITQGGMNPQPLSGSTSINTFAQEINANRSANFPVAEGGGIGGLLSGDGKNNINKWLALFPGKYVGLAYGTNDAGWSVSQTDYYNNMKYMVDAVIAAGKTPVIPTIPWARGGSIEANAPGLNTKITQLYSEYPQIIHGPDLWTYFRNNQSLISADNIHPTAEGYVQYRRQWVNAMLTAVYSGSSPAPTATPSPTSTPTATVTATPGSEYMVDNFEYASDSALQSAWSVLGNPVTLTRDTTNKIQGSYSMKYVYQTGANGYSGAIHAISQNWSGYANVSVWVKPANTTDSITVQFKESSGEYWESVFTPTSTSGQAKVLPLSGFAHPGWYSGGNGVRDLGSITEVSVYINGNNAGTVYFDDLKLTNGGGVTPTATLTPTATPTSSSASPTATPTATATATATASGAALVIYGDSTTWENWSWSTTANFSNTSPVYAGANSISVDYTAGWAGLSLYKANQSKSGYTKLQFYAHGGSSGTRQINVCLVDTSDVEGPVVSVDIAAGAWALKSIDLSSLGSFTTFTRINFKDRTGVDQPVYYLDEIKLVP